MGVPIQLKLRIFQSEVTKTSGTSIDDRGFPEEAANQLARLESFNKHLYRPNTYLHKWWARRSGTTFRYILKQLVTDLASQDFYVAGGLEGLVILDPMMGGGTILHEAIRMGANVVGVDIDPIPVVQARATLTASSLFHRKLVFRRFFDTLRDRIAFLYQTACPICGKVAETQFILYGLRRRCSCREVLFVDSFLLRQNHGHDVFICSTCREVYVGPSHNCLAEVSGPSLAEKGTRRCDECDTVFADILDEPFSERYVPLVVVGICQEHDQFFKTVQQNDLELIAQARAQAQELTLGEPQHFRIPAGPKSGDLIRRGITSYQELFTPRQLLYLSASLDLLSELPQDDRLWLALLISTSLEFNSLLCGYKGAGIRRPGAIRHVFSHHAYSFPYTALENNPVLSDRRSGTLRRLFYDRILKAGKWAIEPVERLITANGRREKIPIRGEVDSGESVCDWKSLTEGERRFFVMQGDSADLDIPGGIVDYVVTDPPYYDSVQYSDLSNFFRIWLRLFLPQEADWSYDPLGSAVSEGNASGRLKYGEVMGKIWKQCHQTLDKERGRLIFTFHHWNHEAWAELTISLKRAGFVLTNRHVVFSENPISVHIRDLKALKHDTILVLKPDANGEKSHQWLKPTLIDTSDSYTFCRDCGTALGWFLSTDTCEEDIRKGWKHLLEGENNGNDKASI